MSKVYLVYPDTSPPFDVNIMATYVASLHANGYIDGWWHYLPGGLFFVNTNLEVNQLYNLMIRHMPNRKHIIMEVEPKNQQGWLQKEAWDWFKSFRS